MNNMTITIVFVSKKHSGGYGDRLIGMASALTVARILNAKFFFNWEPEFMNLCEDTPSKLTDKPIADEVLSLVNQRDSEILRTADLHERWAGKTVVIEANIPCDIHLWKNPHLAGYLQMRPYEQESIRSFHEIFAQHMHLNHPLFLTVGERIFDCGIQIRCGDPYCMPHSMAEQYISEARFDELAIKLKQHLVTCCIKGKIYVTSDTHQMYKHFTALNDDNYTFVFRERKDDIHFDFWNANNRYAEVLVDHLMLMQCREVITGLRSNYGTTAAYCSPICVKVHLYDTDFNCRTFDSMRVLVLKEYQKNLQNVITVLNDI
jgi:hypothetical protein